MVTRKLQTAGMTSRLSVNFKKPVSSSDPQLSIRAWIADRKRNFVNIHVELRNAKDELCAEGDALYFAMGEEKAREMGFTECGLENEEIMPF